MCKLIKITCSQFIIMIKFKRKYKEGKAMNNDLLRWRKEASADEWSKLAFLADTTIGYLNLIAYGVRRPSPDKAKKIEDATKEFPSIQPVTKESLVFANQRITAA